MKVCTQCSIRKPLTEFNKRKAARDGHRPNCRSCDKDRERAYYYQYEYRRKSPLRQLINRTANRIRCTLQRADVNEHPPPLELLQCTYEHLANHLGDIGDKEIDHIIPLSRYNLHDPIDLQHAFHWQNTQLLTREENNSKGNKLPSHDTLQSLNHLWPNSWWHPDCDQYFTDPSIAY